MCEIHVQTIHLLLYPSPPCIRLNISVEEVQPSDREKAKRVVYAIVYGVGKQKDPQRQLDTDCR